jgi:hypothetical protein
MFNKKAGEKNLVKYRCKVETGQEIKFDIDINRALRQETRAESQPPWTALDFYKCSNCPMASSKSACCPAALDIRDIAESFSLLTSHNEIEVFVETSERNYFKKCDVQTALSSLFGLVMATSACPILCQLKSLALFHLPFATLDETIFRTVGAYLLKQYFLEQSDKSGDFTLRGLKEYYEQLLTLNIDFSKRVKAGSRFDGNINALIKLFVLSESIFISLEKSLERIEEYFNVENNNQL